MNTQSYTMQLVESMMNGLIEDKLGRGYSRLNNGLFEDCLGQVFTVNLEQSNVQVEEDSLSLIKLVMKPVSIAGRI